MQEILKKIIFFFKLIRYPNLIIIIFTQLLTFYFITDWQLVHSKGIILLVTGTVLIAAAGYMINDLFDIDIDLVNKPKKVLIPHVFSKQFVIVCYSLFNLVALMLGIILGKQLFFNFVLMIMLLILYSSYLKRLYLLGNLVVSFLLALSVYLVWIYCPAGNFSILSFYICFAFLISLIREIIKDIEDINGDLKFDCLTMPVVTGVKAARNVSLIIVVFLICLIEFSALYFHLYSSSNTVSNTIFLNIFVVIPLILVSFKLIKAEDGSDYHNISRYLKLIMITGLLSIISLKFNYPI